jgi:hypothetical protein
MSDINIAILLDENILKRFINDIQKQRARDLKEVLTKRKIEFVEAVNAEDWILGRIKVYEEEQKEC